VFILDRLMIGGIKFVLKTVVEAAEAELNDADSLRAALLDAQMRHELGELTKDELATIEAELMGALRAIEERKRAGAGGAAQGGLPLDAKVTGVEITFGGDEPQED
jgi:hypothetical protein